MFQDTTESHGINSTQQPEVAGCVDDSEDWFPIFRAVLSIGPSVLIVVGTIGNTVTYFVLKRKAFKKNVVAGALQYLAVIDTIILWTVVLEVLMKGVFSLEIPSMSWETCGLIPAYIWTITSLDSWILVVITGARLIHIKCPFSVNRICTKFNYYIVLVQIHLGVVLAHGLVQLYVYKQFPKDKPLERLCYFAIEEVESKTPVLIIINITVNFAMPVILLFTFNILIVLALRNLEIQHKSLQMRKSFVGVVDSSISGLPTRSGDKSWNAAVQADTETRVDDKDYYSSHKRQQGDHLQLLSYKTSRKNESYSAHALREYADRNSNDNSTQLDLVMESGVDPPTSEGTAERHSGDTLKNMSVVTTSSNKTKISWISQISASRKEPIFFAVAKESETSTKYTVPRSEAVEESHSSSKDDVMFQGSNKRNQRLVFLTRLLLTASLIYFISNVPFWIFHIFFAGKVSALVEGCYKRKLILNITFLLQYLNHSVNFYIYCATGSQFRQEFFAMIGR